MKKSLSIALLLTVSLPALVCASSTNTLTDSSSVGVYTLDEEKAEAKAEEKQAQKDLSASLSQKPQNKQEEPEDNNKPKIIKEETEDGHIEKLISPDGKVIAEKTIRDGEIVKKVLNYYHPNGQISRQITALEDGKGFYAEDYYSITSPLITATASTQSAASLAISTLASTSLVLLVILSMQHRAAPLFVHPGSPPMATV